MPKSMLLLHLELVAAIMISVATVMPTWADTSDSEPLTKEDASTLYGSSVIPLTSYLDQHREDGDVCHADWEEVRNAKFSNVSVSNDLVDNALASARKQKLTFTDEFLRKTLGVFLENQSHLPNQHHFAFIDFDQPESKYRLFVVNVGTGEIMAYHTAAGVGSDPGNTGMATKFSNVTDTNASSLGCFVANGEHMADCKNHGCKPTLNIHGIERTNDNMCDRGIFFHPADYVTKNHASDGSWGCPALSYDQYKEVFKMLNGGGLVCVMKNGPYTEAQLRHHTQASHHAPSRARSRRRG